MLPGEPLSNRAMVVGFGIDLDEGNKLIVSAQILNPDCTSKDTGVAARIVIAEHPTIAGAMTEVSQKAGLTVALTHCNVVVLGENVAKSPQLYSIMNYLITNSYLSENAYLFVSEGYAAQLLQSSTGFGNNASLYVQKLVNEFSNYNDTTNKTLQNFVVDYHQLGQANWLPYLKREEVNESVSCAPGDDKTDYVFTMNSVVVFKKNEFIGIYDADGSSALNYVKNKVSKGNIDGKGDNGEQIVLYILDKKNKIDYDFEKKTVKMEISIDTILKEIIDYSSSDSFVDRTKLSETEITNAQDDIKKKIEDFYAEMQEKEVDIFSFYEGFYSKNGKKANDLNVKDITLEVKVKIEVRDV